MRNPWLRDQGRALLDGDGINLAMRGKLSGSLGDAVLGLVADDHPRALIQQHACGCEAHARVGTRNDRGAPLEPVIHKSLQLFRTGER